MLSQNQILDHLPTILIGILTLITSGLVLLLALFLKRKSRTMKGSRKSTPNNARSNPTFHSGLVDIQDYGINEILSSGKFTPAERATEYRRRGKSPSGVIDGVYNDEYRGNEEYNDEYRDWEADA